MREVVYKINNKEIKVDLLDKYDRAQVLILLMRLMNNPKAIDKQYEWDIIKELKLQDIIKPTIKEVPKTKLTKSKLLELDIDALNEGSSNKEIERVIMDIVQKFHKKQYIDDKLEDIAINTERKTDDIKKLYRDLKEAFDDTEERKIYEPKEKEVIPYSKYCLDDVHNKFKVWINYEKEKEHRMECMLAIALSRPIVMKKLWMIVIGGSGDCKSEMINTFDDGERDTKLLRKLTSKTLVSGIRKGKKKDIVVDLAPKLQDKMVLIPDFASFLTMPPIEKASVWAQLRDLYDGIAGGQTGTGTDADYKDLNVTMLGCSTNAIDNQVLQNQSLGTRELLWRTKGNEKKDNLRKHLSNNKNKIQQMEKELKEVVQGFLQHHKFQWVNPIPKDVDDMLFKITEELCIMRCTAEIDWSCGELINFTYPEEPTRAYIQLQNLYCGLKSLKEDYDDERALTIIKYVVKSSGNQIRQKLLDYIRHNDNQTTNELSNALRLGKKTVLKELNILHALEVLDKIETYYDSTKPWIPPVQRWSVTSKYKYSIEELKIGGKK